MTMHHDARHMVLGYLAKIEEQRHRPIPAPKVCACCGDEGEFDPFAVIFDADHLADLRAHFGGDVCTACADLMVRCEECREIVNRLDAYKHPVEGYVCGSICEARAEMALGWMPR